MTTTEQITQVVPAGTWKLDPGHSTISFEVRDMSRLFATIRGRFTDYYGSIESEPEGVARASGAIRVASLTTDQAQRDEHLRSPEFLDAGAHPEIRFESDRIEAIDEKRIRVAGRLELKGVEQPLAFDGTVLGSGTDQRGAERLAIAAEGELAFGPMTVKLVVDVSAVKEG